MVHHNQTIWNIHGLFMSLLVTKIFFFNIWYKLVFQQKSDATDEDSSDWDSEENMFLVCVYNVSPEQPYTIFKAPTNSTAQDIIAQVRNDQG